MGRKGVEIMGVPRFWRKQPARYGLIGGKGSKCSSLFFPPREICRKCKSLHLEPHKFIGKGEVVTYSIIRVGATGFEAMTPYVLAIIKLQEGPQLTAQMVYRQPEKVKERDKSEIVFRRISED